MHQTALKSPQAVTSLPQDSLAQLLDPKPYNKIEYPTEDIIFNKPISAAQKLILEYYCKHGCLHTFKSMPAGRLVMALGFRSKTIYEANKKLESLNVIETIKSYKSATMIKIKLTQEELDYIMQYKDRKKPSAKVYSFPESGGTVNNHHTKSVTTYSIPDKDNEYIHDNVQLEARQNNEGEKPVIKAQVSWPSIVIYISLLKSDLIVPLRISQWADRARNGSIKHKPLTRYWIEQALWYALVKGGNKFTPEEREHRFNKALYLMRKGEWLTPNEFEAPLNRQFDEWEEYRERSEEEAQKRKKVEKQIEINQEKYNAWADVSQYEDLDNDY